MKNTNSLPSQKTLNDKLLAYSAMGAAFLATAPAAEAAIVYHDPPDITITSGPFTPGSSNLTSKGLLLGINENAVIAQFSSFYSFYSGALTNPQADAAFLIRAAGQGVLSSLYYGAAWNLAFIAGDQLMSGPVPYGSPIGPLQSFIGGYGSQRLQINVSNGFSGYTSGGFLPSGSTNYMGVRFDIGGSPHYGWIQLQITTTSNPAFASITILDYAYEDAANTPIPAGATGSPPTAVPTMSEWGLITFVLLLLSFGTVYVGRRKEEFAMAGENNSFKIGAIFQKPPFSLALFKKTLLGTGILGAALGALSFALTGGITLVDIIGFGIAGPVFAYLTHLMMLFDGKKD
jgi:hypothetical protein